MDAFPASSAKARLEFDLAKTTDVALLFFHELLHGAGRTQGFSHTVLATKLYDVSQMIGIKLDNKVAVADPKILALDPIRDSTAIGNEEFRVEGANKRLIDEALTKTCAPTK